MICAIASTKASKSAVRSTVRGVDDHSPDTQTLSTTFIISQQSVRISASVSTPVSTPVSTTIYLSLSLSAQQSRKQDATPPLDAHARQTKSTVRSHHSTFTHDRLNLQRTATLIDTDTQTRPDPQHTLALVHSTACTLAHPVVH